MIIDFTGMRENENELMNWWYQSIANPMIVPWQENV